MLHVELNEMYYCFVVILVYQTEIVWRCWTPWTFLQIWHCFVVIWQKLSDAIELNEIFYRSDIVLLSFEFVGHKLSDVVEINDIFYLTLFCCIWVHETEIAFVLNEIYNLTLFCCHLSSLYKNYLILLNSMKFVI